ncbi:MAG TPA: hypothetical protein ENN66_05115 [Proteobacteria bacterium]|nr:hypothetical protein [Pseudomonadota bacterium]
MQNPAREIVYRPLFLPLLTLLAVIWLTVCRGTETTTLLLLPVALFVVYGYFLFRLRVEFCFRSFLLLFLFSLLLGGMVFGKLERRRRDFNSVQVQLAQSPAFERLFGRVVAFPQSLQSGWRLCLEPLQGRLAGRGEVELFLPISAYDDPRLPLVGDLISAEVELKSLAGPRHPFLKRIQNSGVSGVVAGGRLESFEDLFLVARFSGILGRVDRIRRFFYRAFLTAGGDNAEVGIMLAVLIGCRDRLPDKVRHLFLDFGVFHLFAISGLHLGIVVGLVFFLGKALLSLGGRWAPMIGTLNGAAGLTLLFIPFYLLLTGLHLPVMRAGIMAGFFLAALLSRRLRDPFSALIGAAIVILFCWPQALFELSFQLSFIAVAALLWSLPQSRRCWSSMFSGFCRRYLPPNWENGLLSCFSLGFSSLAISLATAPLLVNQVHFLSLYALPVNLVLVPLFSLLILPLGMLCLFLVGFPALLAQVLPLLGLFLKLMLTVLLRLHENLPSGRCYLSELTGYETLFLGGLLLSLAWLAATGKGQRKAAGTMVLLFSAALFLHWVGLVRERRRERISLAAFVGGHPQTLLFELPGGEALLFNGGSWPQSSFSLGEQVIAPYCWRRKIKRISTLVLTEPQKGMVGGLLFLVEQFKVREIWYHGIWTGYPPFQEFNRRTREDFGVRWRKLSSFAYPFYLAGVDIEVLGPPANDLILPHSGRAALLAMAPSLLFRYGDFRALVWGGGQLDPACLPEEVDLLALLVDPIEVLPKSLTRVSVRAGGWCLQGGKPRPGGKTNLPRPWSEARFWSTGEQGFLFLEAETSALITDKFPRGLISGCQGGR